MYIFAPITEQYIKYGFTQLHSPLIIEVAWPSIVDTLLRINFKR